MLTAVITIIITFSPIATAHARTEVHGTISANTTWTLAGSPYEVTTQNVTINAGVTLTIEPGVRVEFRGSRFIVVDGVLQAAGTAVNPIIFTGTTETSGWWRRIQVQNAGSATLAHCVVTYGYGVQKVGSGDLVIQNTTIRNNTSDGLYITNSTGAVTLENSVFSSTGNGMRMKNAGAVTATNCQFKDNTEYGVLQEINDTLDYAGNIFSGNLLAGVGINGGTLNGNMTLKPAGNPFRLLARSAWIAAGKTLTVEPGVRMEFPKGYGALVVDGVLQAVGTAASPIVFTGTTETAGWWNRIQVGNVGSATLDHCVVAYGYGVQKIGSGDLVIKNTTIRNNTSDGLYITNSTGTGTLENSVFSSNTNGMRMNNAGAVTATNCQFKDNTEYGVLQEINDTLDYAGNIFSGNLLAGVGINGGTLNGNMTLKPAGNPFRLLARNAWIAAGKTLTVEPGVRMEFPTGYGGFTVEGILQAVGTAASPIVFTGTTETAGWWHGIDVQNAGSATLEHCIVAYGAHGVVKQGTGALALKNSTIRDLTGEGLKIYSGYSSFVSEGNTFSNTNYGVFLGINASFDDNTSRFSNNNVDVYLYHGTIDREVIWNLNPAYSLYVSDNITVGPEGRLLVRPGTVVKFSQLRGLTVIGNLEAKGTASDQIYFTDWRDDTVGGDANKDGSASDPAPGWWRSILVDNAGSATLAHCVVAYAGDGYDGSGILKTGTGSLEMSHSTVTDTAGNGLRIDNSTGNHDITRNTFSANYTGVMVRNQAATVVLSDSNIEGNRDYGVYNDKSAQVDARGNWWGAGSGPYHATLNPQGQGDEAGDGVLFDPWRTSPMADPYRYVSKTAGCGGKTPCYTTVQAAVNASDDGDVILVGQGDFNENPTRNTTGIVSIRGGWDGAFASQTPRTTSIRAPRAPQGVVILQEMQVIP